MNYKGQIQMLGTANDTALSTSLDQLAADCLQQAQLTSPPVDAFVLARRLGFNVIRDDAQGVRGRRARVGGRGVIFIRPDERPERMHWAVAHEIGEGLAHQLADAAESQEGEGGFGREQLANLMASRLLLPAIWFFEDVHRLEGDLLRLKQRYQTASYELIGWRLLDLPQWSTVTVFDQGRATRRQGNGPGRVPPLDDFELGCWQEAHRFGRAVDRWSGSRRVQAWPIHEPQWRREILRSSWSEPDA